MILILSFVSAEMYTINIRGEPKTPDGKIDLMYSAGLATDKGTIESENFIDNNKGFFEIRNAVLDTEADFNYVAAHIQGNCFYYSYSINRVGNNFEVSDGYDPEHKVIIITQNPNIDLGVLKEDKSNRVMIDFDVPVKYLAEDLSGNWAAENGNYEKFSWMSNSFKSNTKYKLTLTTEDGEIIVRDIATGDYCESTRVIKRGNYFVTETNPNNSFPEIGFFRNIWMSILGLRMIVILPLIAIFLFIILVIFLIFRKRKTSNNFIQ
jgi:hypothetical protein